jgi:ADP-ribose pyrophosphatase YjhB (NUDIX family)
MSGDGSPADWLGWVKRLRAIAQTGLAFGNDDYDRDRYRELHAMAERMLAAITDLPPARIRDLYLPEQGYPTPKVDVRAGVFSTTGGVPAVLLVRETSDGCWSLPGGFADEQETPRTSVEREVLEESGHAVRAVKLVAVKDRALHDYLPRRLEHIYKLLFLCERVDAAADDGSTTVVSIETTEARFFPLDALPDLSVGRTLPADIELLEAHRRQPELPAVFD